MIMHFTPDTRRGISLPPIISVKANEKGRRERTAEIPRCHAFTNWSHFSRAQLTINPAKRKHSETVQIG